MVNPLNANVAIKHGLGYLQAIQQVNGGFVSYSSPAGQPFEPAITRHTNFVPALILTALFGVTQPTALLIRDRLADFLLAQRSPIGTFNYWAAAAPERHSLPYPDDLDETFGALIGLYSHRPALINEAVLAQTVKLLTTVESTAGGPYRTWLVPPTAEATWLDTDIAVNANIAYFLTIIGSPLPTLNNWLDKAVATDSLESPYYPTPYPVLYYLSRVCHGATSRRLLAKARQQQVSDLSALDQALCLTARHRLGESRAPTKAIEQLLANQRPDGSWPAAVYCADPDHDGQAYHNGSAALTTALVIEALQLYLDSGDTPRASSSKRRDTQTAAIKSRILTIAKERSQDLAPEVRQSLLDLLAKLAASSSGSEIINLPRQFKASLSQPAFEVSETFLDGLSLANLYGWSAYTVYDDYLDGGDEPSLLPAANVAMRQSLATFSAALPFHRPYQTIISQCFDTIDGANAWELRHCRFTINQDTIMLGELPDYADLRPLAERSLGHIMPVLAILLATGVDSGSSDFRHIRQALTHYLVARQLNDDAHDWTPDLEKGHITFVVGRLLAANSEYSPGPQRLHAVIAAARQQFWHVTLRDICQEMQHHIAAAREALRQTSVLRLDDSISRLLDDIGSSVTDTLTKHREAQRFLKHYGGPSKP